MFIVDFRGYLYWKGFCKCCY